MQLTDFALLLAPEESLGKRLGLLAACLAFGVWMIFVGRYNLRTKEAEETGQNALLLALRGKSTEIRGRSAVFLGWVRIIVGVAAIAFGFVYLFFGAFLKK